MRKNETHAIRLARATESSWVNARYAEVGFLASDLERHTVAIAEVDGARAALGRLVPLAPDGAELGGILVLDPFRGRGIATEVVRFLLTLDRPGRQLYCLPFVHLEAFYEKFGFRRVLDDATVPEPLRDKLRWCGTRYSARTCLMQLAPECAG